SLPRASGIVAMLTAPLLFGAGFLALLMFGSNDQGDNCQLKDFNSDVAYECSLACEDGATRSTKLATARPTTADAASRLATRVSELTEPAAKLAALEQRTESGRHRCASFATFFQTSGS